MMNINALSAAVQDLKGSALKMWLYLNKNQDDYKFELSQKACQLWGIKKDSYYDGVRELESKGYLVPIHEGSISINFTKYRRRKNRNRKSRFSFLKQRIH